ncbi:MAG: S41 family peptidase [Pirellulales bacterium]
MPLRNLLILFAVAAVCIACAIQSRNLRYGIKVGQAIRMVEDYYVNEVDPQELYIAAMDGVVSKLDQFSDFIPPQQYKDFQSTIEQHFGGVGITVEGPPVVNRLTVVAPIPNTPAYKAGIQAGDVILAIDGQSTEGLETTKATKLMRGPVGKPVELEIRRMDSSETISLSIPRAEIDIASVYGDHIREDSKWDYFMREDPRIAYIRITMFGEKTVDEFREALHNIRSDAKAVVIDLRYNPGGVLPAAVQMCDMLVDHGTILRTKGRRAIFDNEYPAEPSIEIDKKIPMIVMVNGDSASASEIMAGCLQDLCRARIAGTRSYGKGTVQQVFELEDDTSALKFTTARFLRPSGKNIHRTDSMKEADEWGITPEPSLTLPMSELEEVFLNRRWNLRGDLRLVLRGERPPEPDFAGDPQLALVVQSLWSEIGPASNAEAKSIKSEQYNSSNTKATTNSEEPKNEPHADTKNTSTEPNSQPESSK